MRVRVGLFGDGEPFFEEQGRALADLVWSPPGPGLERTTTFHAPVGPQFWAWSSCDVLERDARTLAEARRLVETIDEGWRRGDAGPLLAVSGLRSADLAQAYFETEAGVAAQVSAFVGKDPYRPAPKVEFAPRLVADGRLVDCMGADGRPFIRRLRPDGAPSFLRLMAGRRDGAWSVVR